MIDANLRRALAGLCQTGIQVRVRCDKGDGSAETFVGAVSQLGTERLSLANGKVIELSKVESVRIRNEMMYEA